MRSGRSWATVSLSYFNWKYDEIKFASREENLKLIKEAVKAASGADQL